VKEFREETYSDDERQKSKLQPRVKREVATHKKEDHSQRKKKDGRNSDRHLAMRDRERVR